MSIRFSPAFVSTAYGNHIPGLVLQVVESHEVFVAIDLSFGIAFIENLTCTSAWRIALSPHKQANHQGDQQNRNQPHQDHARPSPRYSMFISVHDSSMRPLTTLRYQALPPEIAPASTHEPPAIWLE